MVLVRQFEIGQMRGGNHIDARRELELFVDLGGQQARLAKTVVEAQRDEVGFLLVVPRLRFGFVRTAVARRCFGRVRQESSWQPARQCTCAGDVEEMASTWVMAMRAFHARFSSSSYSPCTGQNPILPR